MDINSLRAIAITIGGAVGGLFGLMFGELSQSLVILVIFMAIDYISGLVVASVFKVSPKSPDGALDSRAGVKGLFRKAGILSAVLIAHWLDVALNTGFVMEVTIAAFIVNEGLSIVENMGLAGVPIPSVITNALTQLEQKNDTKNN